MKNINNFKLTNKIKFLKHTPFGTLIDINLPEDCTSVLICLRGLSLKPVHICLPHQVYVETINKIIEEHNDYNINTFTIIPLRANEYIDILKHK
jgi:hypothetical protein